MRLNRKKRQRFLETIASSDLAFLLIIYFMVTAGFNINTGFIMHLPAKDSKRLIQREDLLRFELDRNGSIIYNEEPISIPETEKLISATLAGNPKLAVIVTIDPQTRWQQVVSFVELVQDLKIDAFSFTMRKDDEL